MSYPNQKIVKKGVIVPKDERHPYFKMNVESYEKACNDLSAEALKLWIYLAKNLDTFELELSPKACERWGIKKDSYYKSVKSLTDKGYLTLDHGNVWLFNEVPYFYDESNGTWGF